MQFQIPQFIETEDRIVGPLTLKQFFYLAGGSAVSFTLYFIVETWLWFLLSLPLITLAVGLAFVKINGQPLPKIIFAALGYYWKPQAYVWQPENPELPKTEATLRSLVGSRFSLENILGGLALRNAREEVQTKSGGTTQKLKEMMHRGKERYEIVQRLTGERRAAKRIDYR